MSKMMDSLARVLHLEKKEQAKRPSLFIVPEPPPASSAIRLSRNEQKRRKLIIWILSAAAIAALGLAIFTSFPRRSNETLPQLAPPASSTAALIREGKFKEAVDGLNRELALDPKSKVALINRAYVLKELGNGAEAERNYLSLIALYPQNSIILNNLGALYLRLGRLSEAETQLNRAIDLDSKYFEARVNLAATFEKRKNWAGALKIFEELISGPETFPEAAKIRERVRRLRSLAVSASTPKEKI